MNTVLKPKERLKEVQGYGLRRRILLEELIAELDGLSIMELRSVLVVTLGMTNTCQSNTRLERILSRRKDIKHYEE